MGQAFTLLEQLFAVVLAAGLLVWLLRKIKKRLDKKRKGLDRQWWYVWFGLSACMMFPLLVNAIISNHWYPFLGIGSHLKSSEWFAFWVSYSGSIVSILLGWIAYRQTELISNQNKQADAQRKQIEHLQELISSYQLKPYVKIKSVCVEVYHKPILSRKEEIENRYFEYNGEKDSIREESSIVVFTLNVEQEGLVPSISYVINSVDWELFDKSRKLIAYNSKNENNLWKDEIVLFLREDQFETRSEQEILKHVTYSKHKQFGYDRSELKFQISFSNAVM